MATFTGMDIGQVRGFSGQLSTSAGQINEIVSKLSAMLGNTQWVGPDAAQFRQNWDCVHVQALRRVVAELQEASQRARQNADDQETTSAR